MKNGRRRPTLNPSPLPIFFLENDVSPILYSNVLILPCPFCLRGFEPLWDCKLISYKHAYHYCYAFNHLSCFLWCLHCEEEMHANWWTFFGLEKPSSKEKEAKEMVARFLGATLEGTCLT
jgi:hypothetical protein